MYAKIAVQDAGIRIVHSLVFKTRDLSRSTTATHRLRTIRHPRRNAIDTDAPAYYSGAMALGKRRRRVKPTSMWVATGRPAAHRRASVLHASKHRHSNPGRDPGE